MNFDAAGFLADLTGEPAPDGLPAVVAVADGFDGGDVEIGAGGPAVRVGEGDEKAALAQSEGVGIGDIVSVPACEADSEGLEGVTADQFPQFVDAHASIVASGRTEPQGNAPTRTEPHGDAPIPYRPPEQWDAADKAVVEALEGKRHVHRPGSADSSGGEAPPGWTPASWRRRLTYLADACEAVRPDLAAEYRKQARGIESADRVYNRT